MIGRRRRPAWKLGPLISVAAGLGTIAVVFGLPWHHPVPGHQLGYRASSSIQFDATMDAAIAIDRAPVAKTAQDYGVDPATLADPRPAAAVYQNLKVVTDGTAGAFMTLQVALTDWVSPREGCGFCHAASAPGAAPASFDWASDANPRKAAARTMIAMTRTVNADWREHVGAKGVTCYTCHRGEGAPPGTWYPREVKAPRPFVAKRDDWWESATTVRDFFPDAGFSEYLVQNTPGHSQSYTALPTTHPQAPVVLARLYEVMMQMSDGIGVNCGYCHNSRAFFDWSQSTPARWVGQAGIYMTQAINNDFLMPLMATIPQTRFVQGSGSPPVTPLAESGLQGGNGLAVCQTCHYANPKPLQGVDLLAGFPTLAGPSAAIGAKP